MTVKETPVREIILDILFEILEKEQYSHLVLSRALSKYQYLSKQDRSFIKRVADGTVEYLIPIDARLNSYSKVKVNKMKPVIRTILRMAVYQICYMDRVPDSAACNEAVKLAEKRGFRNLKGFVNGVLRNIAREKESFVIDDEAARLCLPQWLYKLFVKEQGRETAVVMAESFLKDSPLTVRCNYHLAGKTEILESLKAQGVNVELSEYAADVYRLTGIDYLEQLTAFQKGWIQVQDLSSSLAGDAAGIREGDIVLDVCGAPGGKALHAAELLNGTGSVTVRDVSPLKVSLIEDNIDRSGFTNIQAEAYDALEFDPDWEERADVVLADLPCSGLGVIGRKPDIRIHMNPEKLEELAALQREILSVVQRYVKPGGTLVYSTCTVDRMENEDNFNWFLKQFSFEPVNIKGRLGEKLVTSTMEDGYIQLLPGIHPCDGFFISVLKKINN